MAAIRHGREMLPPDVAEMVRPRKATPARKPEAGLTLADHEVKPLGRSACTVGVHGKTFRVGDKVTAVDRFGQVVTGFVTRFEYLDTKVSATGVVTYRKKPVYYAVVCYSPPMPNKPGSASVMLDVRKLERAHPELPVGRR